MLSTKGLSKSKSLIYLKACGFNTTDFEVAETYNDVVSFIGSRDMSKAGYSIRTEQKGRDNKSNFNYPFYIGIKNLHKLLEIARGLLDEGYTLIVSQTLDPKDTVSKGTVVILGTMIHIEYLEGAGTVRDLERGNPNHITCSIFGNGPLRFSWAKAVFNFMTDEIIQTEMIVEWSYYPYPVGLNKKYLILWELRPWQ